MTDSEKLQAIYDSETNARIDWFWDTGFKTRYGWPGDDNYEEDRFRTAKEAIDWLYSKHMEHKK